MILALWVIKVSKNAGSWTDVLVLVISICFLDCELYSFLYCVFNTSQEILKVICCEQALVTGSFPAYFYN